VEIPGRPWIIAHRGASLRHRENTLEAFAAARALGADAVELDVRRSSDGVVVVHHDAAVPGFGTIADHGFDELRTSVPWVPTLAEALDACTPLWANVEIKNSPFEPDWDPDDLVASEIVGIVPPDTLVSSFNPATVDRVRAAGSLRTGYLVFEGMDREVVRAATQRGLPVIAYTTDDPAEIRRLADAGVAGIITNAPDVAVGVLR
jgi:glycerophosphoryl diester phosphodiesterase